MSEPESPPLSGRKAQAARNDELILEAARKVFVADPGAPIAAVAEQARVGISALYRRYPSKEDLLRTLCANGLARYIAVAEAALADEGDEWEAFTGFLRGVVREDTHSLTMRLAGTFTPTEELYRDSERAQELNTELIARTKRAGKLRKDLEVDDIGFLFEQIAAIKTRDERRTAELRERYLALLLDALRTPDPAPLPGPAPTWQEIGERWQP